MKCKMFNFNLIMHTDLNDLTVETHVHPKCIVFHADFHTGSKSAS